MISNEELWRQAASHPPIQPRGPALAFIITAVFLLGLSTLAVGLRVWSRAVKARANWGWDDTLSVGSLMAYAVNCAYVILAACYGIGTPDEELNEALAVRALLYYQAWEVSYGFAIGLAKTSIGVAILRIAVQKQHRVAVWTLLVVSNLGYVAAIIWCLASCSPRGMPRNLMTGTCAGSGLIMPLAYCVVLIAVITDAGFAVVPILVVRGLQMPPRLKLTLIAVLGMGSLAAFSSVARLPFVRFLSARYGTLYLSVWMPFFSVVEIGVGIVFGCLPAIGKMLHLFSKSERSSRQGGERFAGRTFGGTPMTKMESDELQLTPYGIGKTSTYIWSEPGASTTGTAESRIGEMGEADEERGGIELQYYVGVS